jgi:hypothetical protein
LGNDRVCDLGRRMSQSKMGSVNSPPTIEEKMEGLKGNVYPARLVGNEAGQHSEID